MMPPIHPSRDPDRPSGSRRSTVRRNGFRRDHLLPMPCRRHQPPHNRLTGHRGSGHTFHVGQPNKFKHLKRAFEYMAKHDDVWLTTGDEVNDWYREQYM